MCHLEDRKAAAASIGTPLRIKDLFSSTCQGVIMVVQHFEILLEFLGDLVNEDALGVDVLGPRLAVKGHLHLRKTKIDSNSVKQRCFV